MLKAPLVFPCFLNSMQPQLASKIGFEAVLSQLEANLRQLEANLRPLEANLSQLEASWSQHEANLSQLEPTWAKAGGCQAGGCQAGGCQTGGCQAGGCQSSGCQSARFKPASARVSQDQSKPGVASYLQVRRLDLLYRPLPVALISSFAAAV